MEDKHGDGDIHRYIYLFINCFFKKICYHRTYASNGHKSFFGGHGGMVDAQC